MTPFPPLAYNSLPGTLFYPLHTRGNIPEGIEIEMKNTEKQQNESASFMPDHNECFLQNELASFIPDHDECFLQNESASKIVVVPNFMLTPASKKQVEIACKKRFLQNEPLDRNLIEILKPELTLIIKYSLCIGTPSPIHMERGLTLGG